MYRMKEGLRNSIQNCHLLSRPEPFMQWLQSALFTNST